MKEKKEDEGNIEISASLVVTYISYVYFSLIVFPRLLFIIITHVYIVVNMYIACRRTENRI